MNSGVEPIGAMAAVGPEFPEEPDLSPRRVAALSGCSYWTVLEEIKRGNLRAYRRPGDRLAVRREDFCDWAYGRPVVPAAVDQPIDTAPRRRRRSRSTPGVSDLRELEKTRGAA